MAKKKSSKSGGGYFGLGYIISIILAIIPITNLIFGIIIRAQRRNILGIVLNVILAPLFWIIDLISIIVKNKLLVLV
ncbi:MAG: hypothetical protein PUG90_01270 [Clostridia bacterium]|nr:hypothetical protein [Clostridia bacterium]MDY4082947.1 hypothetical protein [Eubacteriales bacterium]